MPAASSMTPHLDSLTPAMRQYVEQKKRVGDAVLLFRMGDFYETFYDDAVLCSRVLGIALTTRDKNSASPVPLAGIPYHALDSYLGKLVSAGYKVAISEQLEDPKLAKGVVKRDVVRIVTPGTLTEDSLLGDRDDNLLAALVLRDEQVGVAIVELACGRFETMDCDAANLLDALVRLRPAELIISEETPAAEKIAQEVRGLCNAAITRRPVHEFTPYQAQRSLLEHFEVSTLAGFGFHEMDASLVSAGAIIAYLKETQKTALLHVTSICKRASTDSVQIDHSSWRSLEIDRTLRGGQREGSLLHALDRTVHASGGRMLRHWLSAPLRSAVEIRRRQQAVELLLEDSVLRERLRKSLRHLADVERICGRIALDRASPRDMESLGRTLAAVPSLIDERFRDIPWLGEIVADLGRWPESDQSPNHHIATSPNQSIGDLAALLKRAIRENPASNLREGGFIADGYNPELDRLRSISRHGQAWLAQYQKEEAQRSGIASLKAGYNRVFGYYLEVPLSASGKVPADFIRKQTVKNAERYITEMLKNHEHEVLTAQERANQLEFDLFEQLRQQVTKWLSPLAEVAGAIARLDCAAGLAELAEQRRCVQPEISECGELEIVDGRHPVLDQVLGDEFIPNDTIMDKTAQVFVITGPNMAGKSTYIRQVALLTIMAQIGAFVPARRIKLSLVDRIFARVGSSDEIMRGQSTFMVEMTEAANILRNASKDSLVILDELGRGTSTFDGLSLAWAVTEHLASVTGCRTLVATHYHELIELAALLKNVRNFNVAVRECARQQGSKAARQEETSSESSIVFLHKIVEGGANQSFGIHVARLAGVPRSVIDRSREVLDQLQRRLAGNTASPAISRARSKEIDQLPLFREAGDELLEAVRSVDPDRLTPLDALALIKQWKDKHA